jgi:hypothetical protein
MADDPSTAGGNPFEVLLAFLKLGASAFGGPIAHLGYFREEFVRRRRWLDEATYAELVALCQFLPGPASSQVGFAIGLERAGPLGASGLSREACTAPQSLHSSQDSPSAIAAASSCAASSSSPCACNTQARSCTSRFNCGVAILQPPVDGNLQSPGIVFPRAAAVAARTQKHLAFQSGCSFSWCGRGFQLGGIARHGKERIFD